MIGQLRGRLAEKRPNQVLVDVGGVGYLVQVPLSTYGALGELHTEVTLLIHTHVREDALALYGFVSAREKHFFEMLLSASGVGPTLALKILSGMSVEELVPAIRGSDLARLTRIPGVGRTERTSGARCVGISTRTRRQMEPVPELSQRVTALIGEIFPPADAPRIRELVREFHWSLGPAFDDRIHLDILEICGGSAERVRELVGLAKVDWRDLIVAAEYEVRDGKIVQNERGKIRLAELHVEEMRRAADGK